MANVKLTPEVESILRRSTITGNVLVLPEGQLERPLYEAVNKVIVTCGGRWKRGKGHVFESDPRARLGLTLATGEAIDQKKAHQAFYTPVALARQMVQMASVKGKRVLEPSAGTGRLVDACLEAGARSVDCFEINEELCGDLLRNKCAVTTGDFLEQVPFEKFDRVVMNPPFTKRQDLKHVGHAMKFLKPRGRIVAIMQGNRTTEEIRKFVGEDCDLILYPVAAGAFDESGTGIATQIVIITTE